jgi:glucose-1-phosphate thymidylyltransferase
MIFYSIYKLKECGITTIVIVCGKEDIHNMAKLLGSGEQIGVDLTYKIQNQPGGIAEALSLVRSNCENERMVVLLGDNVFKDSLIRYVEAFRNQEKGARILLKEVPDPERYGIAEIKGGKVISLVEKPHKPASNLCVTGIYMYDEQVFDHIDNIQTSSRGELEITDVNRLYLEQQQLYYTVLQGWWVDAGTFSSFDQANQLIRKETFVEQMWETF